MTTSGLLLITFSSKRVQQQKRRKEKERKDLETLGRKSYLDVRIVQRNVVYVVGLGPRYAKEEVMTVSSVAVFVLQTNFPTFFADYCCSAIIRLLRTIWQDLENTVAKANTAWSGRASCWPLYYIHAT
jgi:hypothetical protein